MSDGGASACGTRAPATGRLSQQAFLGISALLLVASAAITFVWCTSMSAMGGMPMPGGWVMSMAWMRMPGQSWPGAAAMFLGMWVVMMMAMMLPSLVPMLSRYRQDVASTSHTRLGGLTAVAAVGYFFVWTRGSWEPSLLRRGCCSLPAPPRSAEKESSGQEGT